MEEDYTTGDLHVEADFPGINDNELNKKTPDQLLALMSRSAFEYHYATQRLREIESVKTVREHQLRIILLSKRIDLIQNEKLRAHLVLMFEDPKHKWTIDSINSVIYLEQKELMDKYNRYEKIAKQAEKEHDMWNAQLMWHQSQNKLDGIEQLTNKSRA